MGVITLVCDKCSTHFRAQNKDGGVSVVFVTIKRLLMGGVEQHCPHCQKVWQPSSMLRD